MKCVDLTPNLLFDLVKLKTSASVTSSDMTKEVEPIHTYAGASIKGIKWILLAVDESKHSDVVAEKVIEMARSFEAKIFLVYVHPIVLALGQPYYDQVFNKYVEHAEHTVAPHKTRLEKHGLGFEVMILEGDPAEMINDTARVLKCDLIVMGSRGLSNIVGLTLGSVSTKVLHSAQCMVLLVP